MCVHATPMELESIQDTSRTTTAAITATATSAGTHRSDASSVSGPMTGNAFQEQDSESSVDTQHHRNSWLRTVFSKITGRGLVVTKTSSRIIPITPSRTAPLIQPETGKPYVSNAVTTARYTFWDFLPKQLYAQFSKIANVYFLFVASLQMVPRWSPTGQYTTLVPLLVFLSIAMAHEGYDDYRRHRQDNVENNQSTNVFRSYRNVTNSVATQDLASTTHPAHPAPVSLADASIDTSASSSSSVPTAAADSTSIMIPLTPAANSPTPNLPVFQKIKWRNLAVGDIVRVDQNDWVPADLILLHSAGHEGSCYVETAALDGETNLKQRQSLRVTNDSIRTPEDIASFRGCAHTEQPNQDLYNFEGFLEIGQGKDLPRHPLSINQILLRGTILRNTPYIYGLVVFSGEDTKIRQNGSKNVRTKAPSMQRLINKVIIVIFCIVIFLSVLCTVLSAVWNKRNDGPAHHAWYLSAQGVVSNDTASVLFGYIVLFNTMIPISLYVTMELVKLMQAYFIHHDIEMYDEVSNTPAEARTTVINEELGQVSYLFSDKTGTLTENIMIFRKFCVAGHSFNHDLDPESVLAAQKLAQENQEIVSADTHVHTAEGSQEGLHRRRKYKNKAGKMVCKLKRSSHRQRSSSGYQSLDAKDKISEMETGSSLKHYPDSIYAGNKPSYAETIVPCTPTSQLVPFLKSGARHPMTDRIRFFLLAMALCHDAVPELMDESDPTSFKYQAASPDENALVAGAKELGYVFVERSRGGIRVRSLPETADEVPEEKYYEILNVLEFSSKRKRMSVVYRMPDGQICLFTKGADSIILERVRDPQTGFNDFQNLDSPIPFTPVSTRGYDGMDPLESLEYSKSGKMRGHGKDQSSTFGAGVGNADAIRKNRSRRSSYDGQATGAVSPNPLKDFGAAAGDEDPSFSAEDDMGAYFFGQTPGWTQSEMWEYQQTMDHIQEYATTGLRTLLYGHRFLSKEEYSEWSKQYADAQSALEGRQEKLEQVAELLEQNLDMTGATAIEDKLQEGVPETIDKLRRAGIRLWMLTGDKRETAINIGYSCRLIKDYSSTIILDVPTQAQAHRALNKAMKDVNKGKSRHVVVVIDGATLGIVEQSPELMVLFVELGIRADSVICCRVSPAQKALVVKTVRANCKNTVTMAIGDGANDIAMIQEANVGIGITGKEGLQAARSSDYSIAQFRFLERLLFVHGRWSYVRISKFVLGTFYKCATFYLTQGLFQIFTGFSGTSLYEQWTLSFYNTLFSSLPVMVVGMFEQDLKATTLLLVPELYTYGQRNCGFSLTTYGTWMAAAVYQAIASLLVPLWIAGAVGKVGVGPDDESLFSMGLGVYTTIVLVVTFKIAYLETHNWSIITHITSLLTIIAWFGYNTFYSFFYPVRTAGYQVRGVFQSLAGHLSFWLTIIVAVMIAILPNIMAKILKAQIFPSDVDLYQELEKDPDAVQRWKEWEAELGSQGAEAEGVTGSKIQRRLSIAASIVSRQSSRAAPSLSSRRGRTKSPHTREGTIRSERTSATGRRSHDVQRGFGAEGLDQAGDLWTKSTHRRGVSSASQRAREQRQQQRKSFSGHRLSISQGANDVHSGPWSATQLNFSGSIPIMMADSTSSAATGGLRRTSSTGSAIEHMNSYTDMYRVGRMD
ncbi:hypothetical protein BGZ50_001716 [Haplosporangium sp. Z 11]|nr:hypothetical protein BGZ50_001716 [Haplosporangium sp. Z 11]